MIFVSNRKALRTLLTIVNIAYVGRIKPMVADYCRELGFSSTSEGFVQQMRQWLTETAETVDLNYPDNGQVTINENREPTLRKLVRKDPSQSSKALEAAIIQRLPERNILDILCNVEHWTKWTRHFGPLSGSDPKLEHAVERYIITSFDYGCNLGPDTDFKAYAEYCYPTHAFFCKSSSY